MDDLQKLLRGGDPKVKLGEIYRREETRLVLVRDELDFEFKESGKAACIFCLQLLSTTNGNHIKRHLETRCKKRKLATANTETEEQPATKVRKITDYNDKRFRDSELKKLVLGLAKYCLRSGRSYNSLSDDDARELIKDICNAISSGYGEEAKAQLPCRLTVQKYSEELGQNLINRVHQKISPYIGSGMNFIVDHGKLVVNYLSLFVSFLDDEFKLNVVPLAFSPAIEGKSGKETSNLIRQKLMTYGWTEEQVRKCNITADGALSNLGLYFNNYIRCVSHSLNLVCQKMFNPLEAHKSILRDHAAQLDLVSDLLKYASQVSTAVRSNATICGTISRLPSLPVETRWMSGVRCLHDVMTLMDELDVVSATMTSKGRIALNKLNREFFKASKTVIVMMEPLLRLNDVFQSQSAITLHLVLPTYKHLETKWRSYASGDLGDLDEDEICTDTLTALSESGCIAIQHYYAEFSDIHYAAVMLSPRTKKMKNFSTVERSRAKDYVVRNYPIETPITKEKLPANVKENAINGILNFISDEQDTEDSCDELQRYLSEHVDSGNESLEEYWRRKRIDYPNLHSVAACVFSVVASESVCEGAFSVAGYLLDKRRTRLQYSKAEIIVLGSQLAKKYPELIQ